jgi:hypothetical protein
MSERDTWAEERAERLARELCLPSRGWEVARVAAALREAEARGREQLYEAVVDEIGEEIGDKGIHRPGKDLVDACYWLAIRAVDRVFGKPLDERCAKAGDRFGSALRLVNEAEARGAERERKRFGKVQCASGVTGSACRRLMSTWPVCCMTMRRRSPPERMSRNE